MYATSPRPPFQNITREEELQFFRLTKDISKLSSRNFQENFQVTLIIFQLVRKIVFTITARRNEITIIIKKPKNNPKKEKHAQFALKLTTYVAYI